MKVLKLAKSLVLAMAALASTAPAFAQAQAYPSRPIRLIAGLAPGSAVDALSRQYAQKLSEILKTSVIVENKPGAGQIVAINAITAAQPDGYTLYMGIGSALSQGPGIRKDLPYDPLKAFTFIAHVGSLAGMIYASSTAPVQNFSELVSYAKANPSTLNYASAGQGTAGHLGAELFQYLTGTKLFHVPFRSDPEAAREAAAGTVNLAFVVGPAGAALAEAGKLRPLMVIGAKRVAYLPNVPNAAEVKVRGLESIGPFTHYGIVGPAGMPPAVVEKLNQAINQATASPEVAAYLKNVHIEPSSASSQEFRSYVENEIAKWRKLGENVKIEF
ncbi:Bug family tripartite tricarboxylate transporter substrate binding protein [Variovorax sp. LjRoot178]|uniref:Bug family tripartite tricarboxylate transporter substrate binding protein n=1 Tax=Variovorax sp. LjRoot178 TaxID=3342277 RepID=UPI003ECD1BA2